MAMKNANMYAMYVSDRLLNPSDWPFKPVENAGDHPIFFFLGFRNHPQENDD